MDHNLSEKVDIYKDEIIFRNCGSFRRFTFGGMWITGVIVLIGLILSAYTEFIFEYLVFFLYFCVAHLVARYCDAHKYSHIAAVYYIFMMPIMAGGILMGTVFDPTQPALTIMVLLCTMLMFVTDKPWRVVSYQLLVAVAFIVCCYFSKDSHWFWADMVDLAIFLCIALGVNFFALRERIEAAENFILVREKSETDALTGLFNRGTGEDKVKQYLRQQIGGAFVILDVDNFKGVNDNYGHENGDQVLRQVSLTIRGVFRPGDILWRMGGDEFAVFAPGLMDQALCENRFEHLLQDLERVELSDGNSISVGLSIGCILAQNGKQYSYDDLYCLSDKALYQAKNNGKNGYVIDNCVHTN